MVPILLLVTMLPINCLIDGPHSSWWVRSVGLFCGVVLFVSSVCGCRLRMLVGCLVDRGFGVVRRVVVSVFAQFSIN
jgi:hypothetical protein